MSADVERGHRTQISQNSEEKSLKRASPLTVSHLEN